MAQKSLDQNLLISFSKIPIYLLIWLWSKLVKQVSQFDWRGLGKQLEQWLVSSSVTSSLQNDDDGDVGGESPMVMMVMMIVVMMVMVMSDDGQVLNVPVRGPTSTLPQWVGEPD